MEIKLPYPPSLNALYRMGRSWSGKKQFYMQKKGADYKREVWALTHHLKPFKKDIRLRVDVAIHPPNRRHSDIDNLCKVLLDSMQGNCYASDQQIDILHLERLSVIKPSGAIYIIITSLGQG